MAATRVIRDRRTVQSIVRAYKRGASLAELADEHGCAVTAIRNYLLAEGVEMRPRGGRRSS